MAAWLSAGLVMKHRWVYVNGEAVKVDADYIPEPRSAMVMPDIQPYKSMCDGTWITSRSQHREHLKAHNVIEIGNEKLPGRKPMTPPPGLKERLIAIANEKLR